MRCLKNRPDLFSLLTGLFVALAGPDVSQAQPDAPTAPTAPGNRELVVDYRRAVDFFEKGDLRNGLALVQQILNAVEQSEDTFVANETGTSFQSLKGLCLERLKTLSERDMELYELRYGPDAAQLLDAAHRSNDPDALESISRRYFYTRAGESATRELALRHLDSGQPLAAALQFNRLLRDGRKRERWEPGLSLQAAMAWSHAGMPAQSLEVLRDLAARTGQDSVTLAGRTLELPRDGKVPGWLAENSPARPVAANSWPLFLGRPDRVRDAAETTSQWQPIWRSSVFETFVAHPNVTTGMQALASRVLKLARMRLAAHPASIPAQSPIVVGDTVIFRQPGTIKAVQASDGELLWESFPFDPQLAGMFDDTGEPRDGPDLDDALVQYAFYDTNSGTLSSDGRYVYAVEETGHHLDPLSTNRRQRTTAGPVSWNKLRAYEIESGHCDWVLSGKGAGRAAAMLDSVFFLGPPLPFGGDLLTIVASRDEIRLLQIQMDYTGEFPQPIVVWSQGLAPMSMETLTRQHRMAGLSPSFGGGVLVCPTCTGRIVALDPATRRVVWQYNYASNNNLGETGLFRSARSEPGDEPGWTDAAIRIAHDRVICTPRDSDTLHCLDLRTGELLWQQPRASGLYVAAVTAERVVVVGSRTARAFRLEDGSPGWTDTVRLETPSGRGLRHGGQLTVPLTRGRVAIVDLRTGRRLVESVPSAEEIGNLVAVGGTVVSQSLTRVTAFASAGAVRDRIDAGLRRDPANLELLTQRGVLRLQAGNQEGGLADLLAAVRRAPTSEARGILINALSDALRRDFRRYLPVLEEIEQSAASEDRSPVVLGLRPSPAGAAALALARAETARERLQLSRLWMEGLHSVDQGPEIFAKLGTSAPADDASTFVAMDRNWSALESRVFDARLRSVIRQTDPEQLASLVTVLRREASMPEAQTNPRDLLRLARWSPDRGLAEELRQSAVIADRGQLSVGRRAQLLESLMRSSEAMRAAWACREYARTLREARPAEARHALQRLTDEFQETVLPDGLTGRELISRWKTTGEFERLMSGTAAWPVGTLTAEKAPDETPRFDQAVIIPSLNRATQGGWIFFNTPVSGRLIAEDATGLQRFRLPLDTDALWGNAGFRPHHGAYAIQQGTTCILRLKTEFRVYDVSQPGTAKRLWSREFVAAPGETPRRNSRYPRAVGPVCGDVLLYQRGDQLVAANLWNGQTQWSRRINLAHCWLLADERRVLVMDDQNEIVEALDTLDGRRRTRPQLPKWWKGIRPTPRSQRPPVIGTSVLSVRNLEPVIEVARTDLAESRTVWRHEFAARTVVSPVTGGFLAAVEPSGQVHIVAASSGRVVLQDTVDPEPSLREVYLHVTADQFVIFTHAPANADGDRWVSQTVSLVGFAHGFDRRTSRHNWTRPVDNEAIRLTTTGDILSPNLPVLLLLSRARGGHFGYRLLDTRSGETVFTSESTGPNIAYPMVRSYRNKSLLDFQVGVSRVFVRFGEQPQ